MGIDELDRFVTTKIQQQWELIIPLFCPWLAEPQTAAQQRGIDDQKRLRCFFRGVSLSLGRKVDVQLQLTRHRIQYSTDLLLFGKT